MFPTSSAANYQLHFFLSLLGCFLCPPLCSTLSLRGTALPWSWEGWGQVLRRSLQGPLTAPRPREAAWEATPGAPVGSMCG